MGSDNEFNGFQTRSVHAGARPDANTGSRAQPIHQTTSYVFESPDSAAAYFNLQEYGNTYSRIMNPTVGALEERIANLEGAVGGVALLVVWPLRAQLCLRCFSLAIISWLRDRYMVEA